MDVNILNSVASNISETYKKNNTEENSVTESLESSASNKNVGTSKFSEEAAVYEKSDESKTLNADTYQKTSNSDRTALIQQLKADQEKMKNSLMDIVMKTINGQGSAFAIASEDDMWKFLAEGKFEADADTIAKAKEDISEDGYWGVNKTSDRIVDFAIALSGGDSSKADELLEAFKKGYQQATGTWGRDLPDISSKTYDSVLDKFEQWKKGTYVSGGKDSGVTVNTDNTQTEG